MWWMRRAWLPVATQTNGAKPNWSVEVSLSVAVEYMQRRVTFFCHISCVLKAWDLWYNHMMTVHVHTFNGSMKFKYLAKEVVCVNIRTNLYYKDGSNFMIFFCCTDITWCLFLTHCHQLQCKLLFDMCTFELIFFIIFTRMVQCWKIVSILYVISDMHVIVTAFISFVGHAWKIVYVGPIGNRCFGSKFHFIYFSCIYLWLHYDYICCSCMNSNAKVNT